MNSTAIAAQQAAAKAAAAAASAAQRFTIEVWTLLAVGILVTMLRTYARIRAVGFRRLGADDILAWIAVILFCTETGLAYSVGNAAHGLANNDMTPAQREALHPSDVEYQMRVLGSKIQLAGWSVYSTLLWTLKASLLVFYLRLTEGLDYNYRIRIMFGFGLLIVTYLIVAINLYAGCRPFHKYWQIFPDPGSVCYPAVSTEIIFTYLAFNVLTDVYVLSIPLPMLWQTKLRPVKKFGLMFLFGGGTFVIVCSILRSVLIFTDKQNGAQQAGSWAVRETFVAVVTSNLPMIFPLFKGTLVTIFGSLLTSVRSSTKGKSGNSGTTGTGGQSRTARFSHKSWPSRAVASGNRTLNESEEQIVGVDGEGCIKMGDIAESQDDGGQHTQNHHGFVYAVGVPQKEARKSVRISVAATD